MKRWRNSIFLFIFLTCCKVTGQEIQWVQLDGYSLQGDSVVLTFTVADFYHIQSDQPEDENLIPTVLQLGLPDNVRIKSIKYPESHPFQLEEGDAVIHVFDGTFKIVAALEMPAGESIMINGQLSYQACDSKKCYFPRALGFTIHVRPDTP